MPRKARKRIEEKKESLFSILQEVYGETCDERARALYVFNKTLRMIEGKDGDKDMAVDMAVLSRTLVDQQKIVQECLKTKTVLAKVMKDAIYRDDNTGDAGGGGKALGVDAIDQLLKKAKDEQGRK